MKDVKLNYAQRVKTEKSDKETKHKLKFEGEANGLKVKLEVIGLSEEIGDFTRENEIDVVGVDRILLNLSSSKEE